MFENIMGHEEQKQILAHMVTTKTISHAYLFTGQKGIGKATLAREFAKAILQTENLESAPDFCYISKKEDKKDIVVEQIRKELIDDVYVVPASGDRKVYLIDEAESLNIASQNALLKTLEEPPSYVVVILVSSSMSAFLPTILSRVNKISFQGVSTGELKAYMKSKYEYEISDTIAAFLEGSIGSAIRVMQHGSLALFEQVDMLYLLLKKKEVVQAFKLLEQIDMTQPYLLDYLEFILSQHEEYMATKQIEKAKTRLKYNGNYDIVMDSMILKIIEQMEGEK